MATMATMATMSKKYYCLKCGEEIDSKIMQRGHRFLHPKCQKRNRRIVIAPREEFPVFILDEE